MSEGQPAYFARPGSIIVTPWSPESIGSALIWSSQAAPADTNWPAAGMAIFVPFVLPEPATATKMFWGNGAAVAGNIDVGIFAPDGTILVSKGSTAQATISVIQVVDITDTVIPRGLSYMGMVSDTSGATQKANALAPAAGILQSYGLLQQASITLPFSTGASPATFAKFTQAFIPFFGVQFYRALGT